MTERSYIDANEKSRARLARLASTMTPELLAVELGAGWTVASAFGHMGFWDRWQAARWQKLLAGNWSADSQSVVESEHLANDALEAYWARFDAADAPALALEAAERLDALLSGVPDALVSAIESGPDDYLLHRHRHRDDHLDHIERSIAASKAAPAGAAADTVDRSYLERNRASQARLREVLGSLTAGHLALPSAVGDWNVGQVVAHLGFWERFNAARWRAALAAGPGVRPAPVQGGLADMLNDAGSPAWAVLAKQAPDAAIAETLAAAQELDRLIEGLPAEVPLAEIQVENPRLLDRSLHRQEHLAHVEAALAGRR